MMTTMAALLGGVPLMLGTGTGSEIRQPLGYAMVGGLIVSQALTLFTTPVVYLYLDRLSETFSRWGRSGGSHEDGHSADGCGQASRRVAKLTARDDLRLDVRIEFQQISVGIPEEHRAMAERLVGRRRQQIDAATDEFIGAGIDFRRRHLEGQLQRSRARWYRRVGGGAARPRQTPACCCRSGIRTSPVKLPQQGKAKNVFVEAAHRRHVAHEDDGVVDGADGVEGRRVGHDSLLDLQGGLAQA